MTADKQSEPIEFLTATEAARRLEVVSNTLKRRITRAGISPDAILLEGAKQVRSPLYLTSRLPQLKQIVEKDIR
jgi:hypothetical protein